MALTVYPVPREGGYPDPFIQAVSVARIRNQAPHFGPLPQGGERGVGEVAADP